MRQHLHKRCQGLDFTVGFLIMLRVIQSNLIYMSASNLYGLLLVLNPFPFTCAGGEQGGLRTGAAPWFRFRLRALAARIQSSVRVHTLFSGEPLGDPALQHATLLRPVREQGAGHGGDFSFCPDPIFLQLRSFGSFTRSAHLGGLGFQLFAHAPHLGGHGLIPR